MPDEGADDVDDEDQPDLDDDDYATIDPEVADQVADAAVDDVDDQDDAGDGGRDDQDDVDDQDDAGDEGVPTPDAPGEGDVTVGHVYCRALGMGAAVARDRRGSMDMEREEAVDEYASMAKQLDLDRFVDEWWQEQMGGEGNLSPGQGIVAMSGMFCVMVLVEDPALADGLADGIPDVVPGGEA